MSTQDAKAWVSARMLRLSIHPYLDHYLHRKKEYEAALREWREAAPKRVRYMPPASLPFHDVRIVDALCGVAENDRVLISASQLHLCQRLSPHMVDEAITKLNIAAFDAREEAARERALFNLQRKRVAAAKAKWVLITFLLVMAATLLVLRTDPTIVWSSTR
ncbi:hypothetical protein [Shinella sp. JR1-6]|uniref:hypothetical protein n=1 Tax=Shinella sp. JR1-6 TaxID=2527671 RepID=UPI00102D46C8|nr:hypothetical protein [Shinella sp. JR1-6]TAA54559.1 hypothetical protein EXZ48_26395 [Shinella sp. JR1-6]